MRGATLRIFRSSAASVARLKPRAPVLEREASAERPLEREALAECPLEREALAERPLEREALAERPLEREASAERQLEREALAERPLEREALAERQLEREALAERRRCDPTHRGPRETRPAVHPATAARSGRPVRECSRISRRLPRTTAAVRRPPYPRSKSTGA